MGPVQLHIAIEFSLFSICFGVEGRYWDLARAPTAVSEMAGGATLVFLVLLGRGAAAMRVRFGSLHFYP